MPNNYRFALTPRWLVGHVIALIAIVAFTQLGLWQLRRLDERRDFNATVVARSAVEAQPIDVLIATLGDEPADLEWRRVEVTGSYVVAEEVIVQGRSHRGRSGHHLVTPLALSDGTAVVVNRGWVPIDVSDPPVAGAEPPAGDVVVRGLIRESQGRSGDDGSRDRTDRLARVDVARLASQSAYELYPFYVDLDEQNPTQASELPEVIDPPRLDEGSHLSYAVQWFVFAALVAVAYPILLARTARPTGRPPAEST